MENILHVLLLERSFHVMEKVLEVENRLQMYSLVKSFKDRKSKGELPVDLVSQLKKLHKLGDIQLISVYWLQFLDGFPDQIILF